MYSLKSYYSSYVKWVQENPLKPRDIETVLKCISFCVTGHGPHYSTIFSEMLYSASNLLTLFNDQLISKRYDVFFEKRANTQLKIWLAVAEYVEVFVEVAACKLWGETGKWLFVTVIQILKTVIRAILLLKHDQNLVGSPSVPPINRSKVLDSENMLINYTNGTYTLISGRIIRSVRSDVQLENRSWIPPKELRLADIPEYSNYLIKASEVMFITKPLIHLWSMYHFGKSNWPPWIISLVIDLASLYALQLIPSTKLSRRQQVEVWRRCLQLIIYLFRCPFYEIYSKSIITYLLVFLSQHVPLVRFILLPLSESILKWQKIYFYLWSR